MSPVLLYVSLENELRLYGEAQTDEFPWKYINGFDENFAPPLCLSLHLLLIEVHEPCTLCTCR